MSPTWVHNGKHLSVSCRYSWPMRVFFCATSGALGRPNNEGPLLAEKLGLKWEICWLCGINRTFFPPSLKLWTVHSTTTPALFRLLLRDRYRLGNREPLKTEANVLEL